MYELKIEKVIAKEAKDVFKSLQAGKLFMNCSADSNSMKIDFRVGGKYELNFKNHKVSNWGEFLEIIPNKKIVFTWCQTFGPDQKPDTKVTIELFPDGATTKLVLQHTGFKDQGSCDGHYQGWNGGINDLSQELQEQSIRLLRRYDVSVEKLFEKVKESKDLFGDVKEIHPPKEIKLGSHVTLVFSEREGSASALEIIQQHLGSDEEINKQRNHWDHITTKLTELFS